MSAFGPEATVPILPCVLPDGTAAFWAALGFAKTYDIRRPYLYLAFRSRGIDLHYGAPPARGLDPAAEDGGGCLVLVDDPAPYHAAFAAALHAALGRVPATGRPRITRFRPGQTRFSLVDPNGNTVIVVAREEPRDLDHGNARGLEGLERALELARVLRDFRIDHAGAARALDAGLRRDDGTKPALRAHALAARVELALLLDDRPGAVRLRAELDALPLADGERARVAEDHPTTGMEDASFR